MPAVEDHRRRTVDIWAFSSPEQHGGALDDEVNGKDFGARAHACHQSAHRHTGSNQISQLLQIASTIPI